MTNNIKEIRFYAVNGAKTKQGGTLFAANSSVTCNNNNLGLEGDSIFYPDGSSAVIERDESTLLEVEGHFVAAVGTRLSNGDIISLANQESMALITLNDGQQTCGYLDENEVKILKNAGGIIC
ncbi:MAG: hypothetical protein LBN41_07120 [Enterobacteriaceae bacterium]|jgi:hypothetical protein|nr:hypothetical protein [Enterobacteriaceae bacterium]